jgi:hypothetical protein
MTGRRTNWVLLGKCAWLAVNLSIWLMGVGTCMTEPHCWLAKSDLLPFLFLLSFPGSILFLIINNLLIENGYFFDAFPALHYTFLSMGALTVGYFQWFHFLPALFGKQEITVLSLNQEMKAGTSKQEAPTKQSQPVQINAPRVQPFDNAGRSPLERVINRNQRRGLTDVS